MFLLFLVGLFCFLLVLGYMLGKEPLPFAVRSIVALAAVGFIVFLGGLLWAVLFSR